MSWFAKKKCDFTDKGDGIHDWTPWTEPHLRWVSEETNVEKLNKFQHQCAQTRKCSVCNRYQVRYWTAFPIDFTPPQLLAQAAKTEEK